MRTRTFVIEMKDALTHNTKYNQYLVITLDDTDSDISAMMDTFEQVVKNELSDDDKFVLDRYFDDVIQGVAEKLEGKFVGFYMAKNPIQVGMYNELKLPAMPLQPIMTIHKGKRVYGKKLVN